MKTDFFVVWLMIRIIIKKKKPISCIQETSVADPWHLGTDADPYLWLTDPDPTPTPDPAIFVSDLQEGNKKLNLFPYYFLKVLLYNFSKIKSHKEISTSRNQGFSSSFCLMIEGYWSVPLTSGSGGPEHIRIRNTPLHETELRNLRPL